MSSEELRAQAQTGSSQIMIAGALWLLAFMIIMIAAVTWIVLAVMAGDFFTNAKVVRDADEAGILSQQGSIAAVKAWVLPLAFVGLATFIAGFGFAFANILSNIRLRANTMAAVLPALKERKAAPQA